MWLKVHLDDLISYHIVGCKKLATNKLRGLGINQA